MEFLSAIQTANLNSNKKSIEKCKKYARPIKLT